MSVAAASSSSANKPDEEFYTVDGQLKLVDASEFTDVGKILMGGVFDTVNGLAHFLIALLWTYIVGYFNFHISWVRLPRPPPVVVPFFLSFFSLFFF